MAMKCGQYQLARHSLGNARIAHLLAVHHKGRAIAIWTQLGRAERIAHHIGQKQTVSGLNNQRFFSSCTGQRKPILILRTWREREKEKEGARNLN